MWFKWLRRKKKTPNIVITEDMKRAIDGLSKAMKYSGISGEDVIKNIHDIESLRDS